jgi:hypothetical protein
MLNAELQMQLRENAKLQRLSAASAKHSQLCCCSLYDCLLRYHIQRATEESPRKERRRCLSHAVNANAYGNFQHGETPVESIVSNAIRNMSGANKIPRSAADLSHSLCWNVKGCATLQRAVR